ncbi:MAG: hypothetical protein ACT4P7_03325 [Gemmatimonadaceae bacterium]
MSSHLHTERVPIAGATASLDGVICRHLLVPGHVVRALSRSRERLHRSSR